MWVSEVQEWYFISITDVVSTKTPNFRLSIHSVWVLVSRRTGDDHVPLVRLLFSIGYRCPKLHSPLLFDVNFKRFYISYLTNYITFVLHRYSFSIKTYTCILTCISSKDLYVINPFIASILIFKSITYRNFTRNPPTLNMTSVLIR